MTGRVLRLSFSVLFSLILTSVFAFGFYFKHTIDHLPLDVPPNGYVLMVSPGMSTERIANQLAAEGALKHPEWFVWWVHVSGARPKLKAGEYLVKPGMTPQAVIDLLISGKVIQHALTLVEGWTFDRVMTAVRQEPKLSQTLAGLSSEEIMKKLGYAGDYPEGQFFPDTYYFPNGTTDLAFLQRAYKRLQIKLMEAWVKRDKAYSSLQTPYDLLVLASIIEKESGLSEEYAEISGVYHRRLKLKMPLQADPTVIYGLGPAYTGQLTGEQLRRKTPYNTYRVSGLPPTPIAMPGEKALLAAARPKPGDSLYFVAKGEGKGHVFSKTLSEHLVAVARYRKKLREAAATPAVRTVEVPSQPSQAESNKTAVSPSILTAN